MRSLRLKAWERKIIAEAHQKYAHLWKDKKVKPEEIIARVQLEINLRMCEERLRRANK